MKKIVTFILLTVLLVTGCGSQNQETKPQDKNAQGKKLHVVTTMFAAYDFARSVGGNKIQVTMLVPPGSDIHAYEPTPKDIAGLQKCDILVYVGGESDAWVEKILASLDNKKMQKIKMIDIVKPVEEEVKKGMTIHEEPGHREEKEYDEHVWTSPANAKLIAAALRDAFSAKDGANKAAYAKNCEIFMGKLTELDKKFKAVVAGSKRKVVVFGDRFPLRYFVDAYGLDYFAAFPGCAHNTEASASTIAFLINKVKTAKIPVVFHIELSNEKIAKAICEATGAKMLQFNTCHNVPKGDFDKGVTYLDLMNKNLAALKEALN